MIGGFNNAGESSVLVFAIGPNLANIYNIVDSIAYFCLGEPWSIHAGYHAGFPINTALGCTLINGGSAPQQDGTLKDCPTPAGITQPVSKRQLPYPMRVISWEA